MCGAESYEEIVVGLDRATALRDSDTVPAHQVIDVQFSDFISDPWATIKNIYESLGRELSPDTAQKMQDFLADHPSDGGRGRYTWSDTGLDAREVRDRVRGYQGRYGVPTEELR